MAGRDSKGKGGGGTRPVGGPIPSTILQFKQPGGRGSQD